MNGNRISKSFFHLGLAITGTIALWASAFVGIRAAVPELGAVPLAVLRFSVASVALLGMWRWVRPSLPRGRDFVLLLTAGVLGIALYSVLINAAELTVDAATASVLVNTGPFWTAVLASLLLGERVEQRGWWAMAISFAGACVIMIGGSADFSWHLASLLILAAAVAQAAYFIVMRRVVARVRPLEATSWAIWIGTLVLLFIDPRIFARLPDLSTSALLATVYLGIAPTVVGYLLWSFVLTRMAPARAGTFLFLVPLAAVPIGWLWLGERPGLNSILGGALVLVGLAIFNVEHLRGMLYSRTQR